MAIKRNNIYIERAKRKKNREVEFFGYLGIDGGLYFQ